MADKTLDQLTRQLAADPGNEALRLSLIHARARLRGEEVYLEALNDRLLWNNSPDAIQDLAIKTVARRLGSPFSLVGAQRFECGGQAHRIGIFQFKLTKGPKLHLLPGGTYNMGSPDTGDGRGENERPLHEVRIQPMLVARFLVTQELWDHIGGDDKRSFEAKDLPIDGVSYDDAVAWLKKLGHGLRLPSESEWEYACRAGTETRYFWGHDMDASYCWYRENSAEKTHPLAPHADKHNAFGLIDILGNLSEHCADAWVGDYQDGPNDHQPRKTPNLSQRVGRGGSWYREAESCRSAIRGWCAPDTRSYTVGFRLARSIQ